MYFGYNLKESTIQRLNSNAKAIENFHRQLT